MENSFQKTYFVSSDIHGYFDEWMNALSEAGFDKENSNHILIVLGDIFDRGRQPLEIYNFLRNLPKERRILVRGNHEQLLKELVNRGFAESHDYHNGTVDTIFQLNGYHGEKDFDHRYFKELAEKGLNFGTNEYQNFETKWRNKRKRLLANKIIQEILAWIDSDEWCNYYETGRYIFVHSYIPLKQYIDIEKSYEFGYFVKYKEDDFREDWRNATEEEWDDAKWGCPWQYEKRGLNKTGKTIVCGHWHTSDFFNNLLYKNDKSKHLDVRVSNPIFKSDKYPGLIGLDACTAATHKVNVLILKESEL